jgi:hypothetical protein
MERLSSTLNLLKNTLALLSKTNYLSLTPLKKAQRPRDYFGIETMENNRQDLLSGWLGNETPNKSLGSNQHCFVSLIIYKIGLRHVIHRC